MPFATLEYCIKLLLQSYNTCDKLYFILNCQLWQTTKGHSWFIWDMAYKSYLKEALDLKPYLLILYKRAVVWSVSSTYMCKWVAENPGMTIPIKKRINKELLPDKTAVEKLVAALWAIRGIREMASSYLRYMLTLPRTAMLTEKSIRINDQVDNLSWNGFNENVIKLKN